MESKNNKNAMGTSKHIRQAIMQKYFCGVEGVEITMAESSREEVDAVSGCLGRRRSFLQGFC